MRNGDPHLAELQWDHALPYAFAGVNACDNWVASCSVCNNIKGDRVYRNINDARSYIQNRRYELGIEAITEPSLVAMLSREWGL